MARPRVTIAADRYGFFAVRFHRERDTWQADGRRLETAQRIAVISLRCLAE